MRVETNIAEFKSRKWSIRRVKNAVCDTRKMVDFQEKGPGHIFKTCSMGNKINGSKSRKQ